jgi:hypothetical protein
MRELRNAYIILVGRPEGKRLLGRRGYGWEDIIKMNLKEIGCQDVEWSYLAQDKIQLQDLLNTVMNLWVQ